MMHQPNFSIDELLNALEPLIRNVVREELERIVNKEPSVFTLNPDMPLYEDMEEILSRKKAWERDNSISQKSPN